MYIKDTINLLMNREKVEIPSGIFSSYNDELIHPLIQGVGGLNPCFIDGIECTLIRNSVTDKYYIKRNRKGHKDHIINAGTKIITQLSLETKGIATIFIGQNGGYANPQDLLNQINKFVEHKGDENVIIITSHGNADESVVLPIKEKYGNKLIDLKKYMVQDAITDAINFGLLPDDGTYPTEQDINAINQNFAPPSLLFDGIHFNEIGYQLLGRLRYKKGKELGYW